MINAHPLFVSSKVEPDIKKIRVSLCSLHTACEINNRLHSTLPNASPGNMQVYPSVAFVIHIDGWILGSAIWTRPVARKLNNRKWIELRRLALSDACPKNTASKSLSIMLKKIKFMFPQLTKAISYQDTDKHDGTIYRASNWMPANVDSVTAEMWASRKNRSSSIVANKIRWEYPL